MDLDSLKAIKGVTKSADNFDFLIFNPDIAKLSLNSTQLNATSISIEAEIALFPVSDKPPTHPPGHP